MNLYDLISQGALAWITQEKRNAQSLPGQIAVHIEKTGKLRLPQREAIEIYLWLKFVGRNRCLAEIIRTGVLRETTSQPRWLCGNATAEFLYCFAQANQLKKLAEMVKDDPLGEKGNWDSFLNALLHDFIYPNYLFSLPMGAGKTYLMAALIYLDLYFARLHPHDPRFAHNFVVFAPQASKTAILPSLQTIRNFDPAWVLPASDAAELRRLVHFEILDSLSSKRRDKLHGNNPNLEKVNRLAQTRDFGLVFITNAEKVVMEKLSADDQLVANPKSLFYNEKKAAEVVKTNALREKLSQIPGISVILDEAHHFFSSSGNDEKKLKLAVDVLNQHGHVCAVLGFSGTPYLRHHVPLAGSKVKLSQIQLIVYHYSLADGIGRFLKVPRVTGKNIAAGEFVSDVLTTFFSDYDRTYPSGTESKIAFYCPSIEKLNTEILPAVRAWYNAHRPGRGDAEIFRFYRGVKKSQKAWALPKDSDAIFNNLDQPHVRKRVVLLVAIGTEGWDCKSLTAVALPRRETTKNFVLQTTCRCLREVVSAKDETALIALGEGNYETLDKELKENYALSIADLRVHADETVNVLLRKPKLGRLRFKNVRRRYSIIREQRDRDVAAQLASFDFGMFQTEYRFTPTGHRSRRRQARARQCRHADPRRRIRAASPGLRRFSRRAGPRDVGALLGSQPGLRARRRAARHPRADSVANRLACPASDAFAQRRCRVCRGPSYGKHPRHARRDRGGRGNRSARLADGPAAGRSAPGGPVPAGIAPGDIRRFNAFPNRWEEEIQFGRLDDRDVIFNYAPYPLDSRLRGGRAQGTCQACGDARARVLLQRLPQRRTPGPGHSHPLWQLHSRLSRPQTQTCQRPLPSPEGLRANGAAGPIDRVLILETKGKKFYDADFQAKEKFVKDVFLKHNPHFRYKCLVDEDDNDFSRHLEVVKQEIESL